MVLKVFYSLWSRIIVFETDYSKAFKKHWMWIYGLHICLYSSGVYYLSCKATCHMGRKLIQRLFLRRYYLNRGIYISLSNLPTLSWTKWCYECVVPALKQYSHIWDRLFKGFQEALNVNIWITYMFILCSSVLSIL